MTIVDAFARGNADQYMKHGNYIPTVGVVTTVHTYHHFLERWAAGVRGLQDKPDRIVIAATSPDEVRQNLDGKLDGYKVVQAQQPFGLGKYLNTAIDACRTDIITWIGVDDRYRPNALNGLRFMDADVIAMGMQYQGGRRWIPGAPTTEQVLQVQENLVPCGSAFHRKFWAARPFQPHLAPFEDWALWVGFAALGARFSSTNRIDFDYYQHADQIVPPLEPTRTRIAEWAKELP